MQPIISHLPFLSLMGRLCLPYASCPSAVTFCLVPLAPSAIAFYPMPFVLQPLPSTLCLFPFSHRLLPYACCSSFKASLRLQPLRLLQPANFFLLSFFSCHSSLSGALCLAPCLAHQVHASKLCMLEQAVACKSPLWQKLTSTVLDPCSACIIQS